MNKFEIRRKAHYKGYIFLLSVEGGNAFWSAHKYEGGTNITIGQCVQLFGKEHDIQIIGLIEEANRNEPDEFKENTILDLTNQQS